MERGDEEQSGQRENGDYEGPPALINLPPNAPYQTKTALNEGGGERKPQPRKKWVKKATSPMGLFTAGLLLVAFVQAVVTGLQLAEMKSDSLQTDKLIQQATRAADAANASSEAAKSAAQTAASALTQNERAFVIEQRPYVWIESIKIRTKVVGQPLSYDIHLVNYGKTPAIRMYFSAWTDSGKPSGELCDRYRKSAELGTGILGSGKSDVWKTAVSVDDPNARGPKLKNWDGGAPITVFGRVFYTGLPPATALYASRFCVEMLSGDTPFFSNDRNIME
jgi:hypothetical protein